MKQSYRTVSGGDGGGGGGRLNWAGWHCHASVTLFQMKEGDEEQLRIKTLLAEAEHIKVGEKIPH